ncbi:hypothetical protein NDA14_002831 [Ustilago hordei]|nr:hypothetical protein NDA10_001138 [Ustilago hordei]KAJ1601459.1 hypothetical protein NDA14_002831 [Ustilago hordei]
MPPPSGPSPFSNPVSTTTELWQRLEARQPLPLQFVLSLSRRPNASLCPCLQVDLQSTTLSGRYFTVTRILDPEHRVPYVSLTPLLLASGLSLIEGLLRFSIPLTSYDLSLAGLEPFDDFWISLPLARSIATELDLLPSLAATLDPKTALAWSLDEFGEGLSHNWRVPEEVVSAAKYSTDAMLSENAAFGRMQILPRGQQIKTLVSGELRGRVVRRAQERRREDGFVLHQRLVRWSAQVYAVWDDLKDLLDVHGEDGEASEERQRRWSRIVEDLREVTVPPTTVDITEWMQLISSPSSQSRFLTETSVAQTHDEAQREELDMLEPLSLAELSQLRSDSDLSETLFNAFEGGNMESQIARTRSVLRAKLSTLHRMTLLSVPHLASARNEDDASKENPLSHVGQRHNPVQQWRALPDPTEDRAEFRNVEVAMLHDKIDKLTAKLDAFIGAQTRSSTTRSLSASTNDHKPEAATSDSVSVHRPADPIVGVQPAASAFIDKHPSLAQPSPTATSLQTIETKPSLVIILISIALFFALIQYQH